MLLVRPIEIDGTNLDSSNVPADTTAEWNVATGYLGGEIVRVEATHRLYEATAPSTGVYPPDDVDSDTPVWLDLGATNRWQMFDDVVGTSTENTEEIIVVVSPGRVNTIGLLNIVANTVNIQIQADGGSVYDKTINLALPNVSNWYEYFYEPIVRKTDVVCVDLPQYGDGVITVTLSAGPTDTVKCGVFIAGLFKKLGETQWGLNTGIISYSQKTINQFGGFSVTKRAFSKRMDADIFMKNNQVDETQRILSQYDSVPILFIGSEDFQVSIIYGFYRDFTEVLTGPGGSHCSLTVEGLI